MSGTTGSKRKRDAYARLFNQTSGSLESDLKQVERFYRRRMILIGHFTLSLALQFAVWVNWYSSYATYGKGFENTFFADRFILSCGLLMLLIGHYSIVRLMETRDRMVLEVLQKYRVSTTERSGESGQPETAGAGSEIDEVDETDEFYPAAIIDRDRQNHRRR